MPSNSQIVLDKIEADFDKASKLALEAATREGQAFSITPTNKTQRPAKKGEGRRKAYSGLWSDVTGQLRNSIQVQAPRQLGANLMAEIFTNVKYAKHLDGKKRREGGKYYVLSGLDKDFDFQEAYEKNLTI